MKTKSILATRLTFLFTAILYAILLAPSAQAQFQFSQRIASIASWPEGEPNTGLALDTNDNCYVTGFFDDTNNFGGVTLTNQSVGGSDIYLAKYNSTGALQWVNQAGESTGNVNYGRGAGTDTNGNVYITGGYQGPAKFGSVNLVATAGEQFFLAKYNSAGTVQWVQTSTGGNGDNNGVGLTVDGAGNSYALVVMDSSGTSITFGTKTVTTVKGGSTFTILVKYDNTGVAQWAQLFDTSQETYATKLAVDATGNVYVRGGFKVNMTIGSSNLTVSAGATENAFVAKFNSSGTLLWVQSPQSPAGNSGEGGVAVDAAGNVFISGYFNTNLIFGGGITLTNQANASALFGDAFLAKYNSSGVIQWAQSAGGTNGGFYWDLALDGQTNIYAAGLLGLNSAVAKYSPTGTLQWSYSASGPPAGPVSSGAVKCAVDAAGHCYLNGFYQGAATFGTNTLQSQETWNFFLAETVNNPTVPFMASPAIGALPLTVQFNSTNVDNQGNTITSWNWNFGDGGTSTLQNPSHIYTSAGTFNPRLVATNNQNVAVVGFGPLITVTNIIVTNPTIPFTASPTNGLPPLAIQFNSAGVDSLGNAITSWNWNFGDGTTSTLQNPSHIYTIANIFLPALTATNSHGIAVTGFGPQIATLTPTPSTCFSYTVNNSAITITGYTCSGGAVNIPSMINGLPVTVIGAAFENNNIVTSVTIPDSVTTIANHAFDSCYSLTSVTIPYSVNNIGNWAFDDCSGLTGVTIPNSVTNIGDGAFDWCSGLTSVTIPNSVTSIDFYGCYSLTNIAVTAGNPSYASAGGVLFNHSMTTLIQYPGGLAGSYTIPNSVTSIGNDAFDSSGLTSVTIGNSVTSIGNDAFAYSHLTNAYFQGNAPTVNGGAGSADSTVFQGDTGTAYYVPGTTGWGSTFGGWPTAGWYQPQPQILGSGQGFGVQSNRFKFTISWATNTSVVVQASTNLLTWTPIITNTLIAGTNAFVDSTWTNYPQRFYRVRSQ